MVLVFTSRERVAFGYWVCGAPVYLDSLSLVVHLESWWYGMYMETDVWTWGLLWELGWLLLSVVYLGCTAVSGLRLSTAI
jgi:hypothetical protein